MTGNVQNTNHHDAFIRVKIDPEDMKKACNKIGAGHIELEVNLRTTQHLTPPKDEHFNQFVKVELTDELTMRIKDKNQTPMQFFYEVETVYSQDQAPFDLACENFGLLDLIRRYKRNVMNEIESVVIRIRRTICHCWNFLTGQKQKTQYEYTDFPASNAESNVDIEELLEEDLWHERDRYNFINTDLSPYAIQSPIFSVRNVDRTNNSLPLYRTAESPNEEQVIIQRSLIKRGRGASVTSVYRHR